MKKIIWFYHRNQRLLNNRIPGSLPAQGHAVKTLVDPKSARGRNHAQALQADPSWAVSFLDVNEDPMRMGKF